MQTHHFFSRRYQPGCPKGMLLCILACIAMLGLAAASEAQGVNVGRELASNPPLKDSGEVGRQHDGKVLTLDLGEGVSLHLVKIPAGSFLMGTDKPPEQMIEKYGGRASDYRNEYPRRKRQVEAPFHIGKHEVTVSQFRRFVDTTGYKTEAEIDGWCYAWRQDHWEKVADMNWRFPGFSQKNNHPVVCITWNDCVEFCRWISDRLDMTFHLPTEVQWEYACRAGTTTVYWWGDNIDTTGKVANLADTGHWKGQGDLRLMPTDDSSRFTSPVDRYRANRFGLHDMIGNVWEWCRDEYEPQAAGHRLEPVDPKPSVFRVLRGGSWGDEAWNCRSATRDWCRKDARGNNAGFRVVAEGSSSQTQLGATSKGGPVPQNDE